MKIDLHTHILPHDWPDLDAKYGYAGFVRLATIDRAVRRLSRSFLPRDRDNAWDLQRRLEVRSRRRLGAGHFNRPGHVQLASGGWPRPFAAQ